MASELFKASVVAGAVPFDNSTNGFTATNTQTAIEEAKAAAGTVNIPEYITDPISPVVNSAWVLHDSQVGSPIGLLLSLTHATSSYKLSYKTTEGLIVRVALS